MLGKRIANIVFYKVPAGTGERKIATIFYSDGTINNVTFEEGIDACEEIVRERHIKTKDAFKEMINHDIVHVVSAKDFRDNFAKYLPNAEGLDRQDAKEKVLSAAGITAPVVANTANRGERVSSTNGVPARGPIVADAETPNDASDASEEVEEEEIVRDAAETPTRNTSGDLDDEDIEEDENLEDTPVESRSGVVAPVVNVNNGHNDEEDSHVYHLDSDREDTRSHEPAIVAPVVVDNNSIPAGDAPRAEEKRAETPATPVTPVAEVPASDSSDIEDKEAIAHSAEVQTKEPEKKEGFFKRTWRKIKESKCVKRVILCVTALAVAFGIYSCSKKKTMEGEMYNSNLPGITQTVDNPDNTTPYDNGVVVLDDQIIAPAQDENVNLDIVNSHFFDNATLKALLDATKNQTQKNAMYNVGLAMDGFNNVFASYYLEDGKDVRAALKFDEVVALQAAYNDYSKEELRAIFNGADIRSADLTRAYKDGSLQLMGAYAIEDAEHPVDMSMLLDTQEGKAFYQRYHEAFLAAKNATGDEKLRLVAEFYRMVRADFPITEKVRTEGISHSQNYDDLEAYKLSVTPMIAAAEMMWQNLPVDETLKDGEIDFINDLGLCNYAQKTFERAELIALTNNTDTSNPTYQQYRDAFIAYYTGLGTYYVDDEHRELTKLQSFQDAVNWHFQYVGGGKLPGPGVPQTHTETHTETETWTETTTEEHEEITITPVDESQVPEDVREELQQQVDAEIEAENEEARRRAEQEAEEERQRLQAIEDQHAAEVEQEVLQDEQDLQEQIDDINEQIDENHDNDPSNDEPVNEHDYEGIDFDDDHSDDQGNLDSSVEDVTTDPTGDMTDQPMPDPEDTGRDFDAEGEAMGAAAAPIEENNAPAENPAPAEEHHEAPAEEHHEAPAEEHHDTPPVVEEEVPVVETHGDDAWVETVPVADDYYHEDFWVEEDPVDYSGAVDAYVETLASAADAPEAAMEYTL